MLVKYDATRGLWVASTVVDGQPVVALSRSMRVAMSMIWVAMQPNEGLPKVEDLKAIIQH